MTQELDEIEQVLIKSIDFEVDWTVGTAENMELVAIDLRKALTALQTYRKTHISIARDDVPEDIQGALQTIKHQGIVTRELYDTATLIAERMKDDRHNQAH